MFYLKKDAYVETIPEMHKTDGSVVPERKYTEPERTVYKHHNFSRFYRGEFTGLEGRHHGMKVYTCKKLKTILELRLSTFKYCGEWFDIYDENGKVSDPQIDEQERENS